MDIEARIKNKAAGFTNLSEDECIQIVLAARALSIEECYDMLLIDPTSLSAEELTFTQILHRRGRAIGIKDAADKLFMHMSSKNGGQTALEYLKQCSGDFSVVVQPTGNSGFQFNVTIPEPGEKADAKVSTGG